MMQVGYVETSGRESKKSLGTALKIQWFFQMALETRWSTVYCRKEL